MGLLNQIARIFGEPVVSTSCPSLLIHPLLHDSPRAISGKKERMVIKLESILYQRAINFCAHSRVINKPFRLFVGKAQSAGPRLNLIGSLERSFTFSSANKNTKRTFLSAYRFLKRCGKNSCKSARIPIESQNSSE